jgi:hypothetical protein
MEQQNINKAIAGLTTLYEQLNIRWGNDPCIEDSFQVLRQEEYRDYYKDVKDYPFEELILQIVSESIDKSVLNHLQSNIKQNINIYKQRQKHFSAINFDALYFLDERDKFDDKLAVLNREKEDIQDIEYPTSQEKKMLLDENRQEINQLKGEKAEYIHTGAWIREDYYSKIHELSRFFLSIINCYFPVEKENNTDSNSDSHNDDGKKTNEYAEIEPDTIFRTRMYEKFLLLERKLVEGKYLDEDLHWILIRNNQQHSIKRLITFLVGLVENNYFLPNKDPKIKTFFESRYNISIGQNFEKTRRTPLSGQYKIVFYDYPF